MPSRKHSGPGRRFATWTVEPGNDITGWFSSPQSPEKTLEEFSRGLTSPSAMVEGGRFAMGVWELPEGAYFPDDVDRRDPAYNTYMQFVGTHQAMVIEARREHPDGTFEHYVIARQPVQNPSSWTTFTYVDNPPSRTLQTTTAQMQVHPEEIFTGIQATEVLARYLLHAALPPKHLLRPINPQRPLERKYQLRSVPYKGVITSRRPFTPRPPLAWTPDPPLSRAQLRTAPGPRFMVWCADAEHGTRNVLPHALPAPQTAQCLTDLLTDPQAMTGEQCFSLGVWTLPSGTTAASKVPKSHPARGTYMQCAGSYQAMTLEIRTTHPDDTFEHYVIARQPVQDPDTWTTITYTDYLFFDGTAQTRDLRLYPEELFTGPQATDLFTRYVLNSSIPPKHLLRPICT